MGLDPPFSNVLVEDVQPGRHLCLCTTLRVLSPGHTPAPREPAAFPWTLLHPSFGGAGIMFFLSFPLPDTPNFLSATRQCGQGRRLRVCYLPRELLSTGGAAERGQHRSLKCCLSLRALGLSVGGAPAGQGGGSKAPRTGPDATLIHRG